MVALQSTNNTALTISIFNKPIRNNIYLWHQTTILFYFAILKVSFMPMISYQVVFGQESHDQQLSN